MLNSERLKMSLRRFKDHVFCTSVVAADVANIQERRVHPTKRGPQSAILHAIFIFLHAGFRVS
jgi:hypothetical protein